MAGKNVMELFDLSGKTAIVTGGGRGLGRALLSELIARCERLGVHQMIAVIGDSANEASIGLHAALGFRMVGVLERVGFKQGRWVDSVIMQRALGGDGLPDPASPGILGGRS